MRIFKNKAFSKWARKENIDDKSLRLSVDEMDDSGNIVGEWASISELSREIKISTHKIKYNIERNKKILNRNFIVS